MKTMLIRYRCTPECCDENERLIDAVFAELEASGPDGFRYAAFRLADDTFVHIAEIEHDNPLGASDAFARFQHGLAGRCAEAPNPQPASLLGSYRFDLGPHA